MTAPVFIVGSPRSGTTILGTVLNEHPALDHWYEPVFVVDKHFQHVGHDRRTPSDATPQVVNDLREAYTQYQQLRGSQIVVDKNPLNSFKVAFLREAFPQAKFLHMLRDGRDVVRSLHVEWQGRIDILNSNNPLRFVGALKRYLDRQPLLRHKIEATLFEIGDVRNLFRGKHALSYRTRRWRGRNGYGPQFEGWEDAFEELPLLAFNAMQWTSCVQAILEDEPSVPDQQFLTVRYEQFLADPKRTVDDISRFLGIQIDDALVERIPKIRADNTNKWQREFTAEQIMQIGPILAPTLQKLGYAENDDWYQNPIVGAENLQES